MAHYCLLLSSRTVNPENCLSHGRLYSVCILDGHFIPSPIKNYCNYVNGCMSEGGYFHVSAGACGGQNRLSYPLKLELQVLRNELGSPGRVSNPCNS